MSESGSQGVKLPEKITKIKIEDELRRSYLDYAMSVIVGRALPDVRDGLKPVHRRVLYAMRILGNEWNRGYKKSARVVGDVIGKYHPHGDSAVYDAIVRMAQSFAMRYLLIDGQGNFGSVDGDAPAAMRYTEIRMSRIASELLSDINLNTVDFSPNYDNTEEMPDVLPTRIPNLLVNGSAGIAVGMATNVPPHNLGEVCCACLALQENPDISIDELMHHLPGPDFPTAAIINGRAGIYKAYREGRGSIRIRGRAEVEITDGGKSDRIIITELPYQVNKARLIEQIATQVKEKRLEGISELRDESDKEGLRVVVELKRGESGEVLLNNLFDKSQLQVNYSINMVALDQRQPKLMNLKQVLEAFLQHRREVITRRSLFNLDKARERAHILEGLTVALANLDRIVELIRKSRTPPEARELLVAETWEAGDVVVEILNRAGADHCRPRELPAGLGLQEAQYEQSKKPLYRLSPAQAQAILDLRLQRLTGLEQQSLTEEYLSKIKEIEELLKILSNPERLQQVVRDEIVEIQERYADERKTEILETEEDLTDEDLIPDEPRVITFTEGGYAVSQSLDQFRTQRRGGIGRSATSVKTEDLVTGMLVANTHETLLCFSNRGKVHWIKVFRIPTVGFRARGRPMVNLLSLDEDEKIEVMLPLREYHDNRYIICATNRGQVKRTPLTAYARPRRSGIIALTLREGHQLISTRLVEEQDDVLLFSSKGRCVRFKASEARATGRSSSGVRGMRLSEKDQLISMIIPTPDNQVLCISTNGYGKRVRWEELSVRHRGTAGVIAMRCNDKTGELLSAVQIHANDEFLLISDQGTLIRINASDAPVLGRYAQGVRIVRLREGEHLVGVSRISHEIIEPFAQDNENNPLESPPDSE